MSIAREAAGLLIQIQTKTIPWAYVYAISTAIVTGAFIVTAVGFNSTTDAWCVGKKG